MTPDRERAYLTRLRADAYKMMTLEPRSDAFLLALVTNIRGDLKPELRRHVIKYSGGILAAAARHGHDGVESEARNRWIAELGALKAPISTVKLKRGEAWGLEVGLEAYLLGPLPAIAPPSSATAS